MRRPIKNKHVIVGDIRYNNPKVSKFINYIMLSGKKNVAREIVYEAFDLIKEQTKKDPIEVFNIAIQNTGPSLEVRSKRIGGSNYQIPREVREERRFNLSCRWIKDAARSAKGKAMKFKLAAEIIAAANNEGTAIKKKEDTHKMAESNKAFAHFGW